MTHLCHESHIGLGPMSNVGKLTLNQSAEDHIQKLESTSCLQLHVCSM